MNYLSIDVGTTNCKCQLFSDRGEILAEYAAAYGFYTENGETYVDVVSLCEHVRGMISAVAAQNPVDSICISSFGESFVLLGANDEVLFRPMLYTDPRGEEEALAVAARFSKERMFFATGTLPHSMYSLSKLLWIKNHAPKAFAKADKLMLLCDYLGYLLTGERAIDYALAARTGAFDIGAKQFDGELLAAFSIPAALFSAPKPTGSVVGRVKEKLCKELGLPETCTLVLGSHDQVCSALGAGALEENDAVDGMGTVECITALFREKPENCAMGEQGYVCVPYAVEGLYCTYMFNYSCGSLVSWFRNKILHGYKGKEENFFGYAEKNMRDEPSRVLALPYFAGAATPYQDIDATGALLRLTAQTEDAEIYRAILEACAMEMKLNAETVRAYGVNVKRAVATGGGANSEKWLQIKADIQDIPIRTLRSSEGGLCGCAMLQAVAMGTAADLNAAAKIFVRYTKEFTPRGGKRYAQNYAKYKKLYQLLKEID